MSFGNSSGVTSLVSITSDLPDLPFLSTAHAGTLSRTLPTLLWQPPRLTGSYLQIAHQEVPANAGLFAYLTSLK